jgi:nucleoid DNA-binding protein
MDVAFYISELLYSNDCVILPGFGGFVSSYAPAKIHPVNHTFYPPSKNILFNSKLTRDDGLLVDYVATEQQISYSEAKSIVDTFIHELETKIQKGKKTALNGIGIFFLDKKGNLLFDPDSRTNYLEESFGLPSIVMRPIDRKSRHQKMETGFIDRKPESQNARTRRRVLYTSLTVVPAILLIGWFVFIGLPKTDFTQKSGMVNLVDYDLPENKPEITETEVNQDPPIESLNFEESKTDDNLVIEEQTPELAPTKKYYIIGGSFSNEENAAKLVGILRAKGYDAQHAGLSRKGLFAVAYFSTPDKDEALANLAMIRRDDNPAAWLLKK